MIAEEEQKKYKFADYKLPWWKNIIFAIFSVVLFPFRFIYLKKFFPAFLQKPEKPYEIHKGKSEINKKAIVVFRGSDGSLPGGLIEKLKEQKPDCYIVVVNYDKKHLGYTITDKKAEKFVEHVCRDLNEKGYDVDTVYGYSLGSYFASLMIPASAKVNGDEKAKEKLKEMNFFFDRGFTSFADCNIALAMNIKNANHWFYGFLLEVSAFHFRNFCLKFENFLMSKDLKNRELILAIDPMNVKLVYGERDTQIPEETNIQEIARVNKQFANVATEKVNGHSDPASKSFTLPNVRVEKDEGYETGNENNYEYKKKLKGILKNKPENLNTIAKKTVQWKSYDSIAKVREF